MLCLYYLLYYSVLCVSVFYKSCTFSCLSHFEEWITVAHLHNPEKRKINFDYLKVHNLKKENQKGCSYNYLTEYYQ